MAQAKNPRFTTPRVEFIWPVLFEPDFKFNSDGEFRVKAKFSAADMAAMLKTLKPLHEQADAQGKKKFAELTTAARKALEKKGGYTLRDIFTPVYDDNEDETGEGLISFKMKHKVTRKKDGKEFTLYPDVFDAKGKPLRNKKIDVGSGSTGKVTFEAFPYFNASSGEAGLSFRMIAVQLIDVVQFGQRSASQYGFGEEEGFDSSDLDDSDDDTTSDSADASGTSADEDDF